MFCRRLVNATRRDILQYESEIGTEFWTHIAERSAKIGRYVGTVGFPEVLYSLVRHVKPSVIVETGVGAGLSTAFILKALEDNGQGRLYSIDLPNYEETLASEGRIAKAVAILPPHVQQGFVIPKQLKYRWELLTQRTQEALPSLLRRLGSIDIFFHDGEHTYENMLFEYSESWPFIRSGGLLLSDNITDNKSFVEFTESIGRRGIRLLLTPLGGVSK